MGSLMKAICRACGYESGTLRIGDGLHFISACYSCNSIVNPQIIPFRFTSPPCPNCSSPIQRSGFVDALYLPLSSNGHPITSTYRCPRCKKGILAFQEIASLIMPLLFEDRFPAQGTTVHGALTDSGTLRIPGLLISGEVLLEDASSYAQCKPMELQVVQVDQVLPEQRSRTTQVVRRIVLQFVRYLSPEESA